MMTLFFSSQLFIVTYFSIKSAQFASAQDPIVFPDGAKSLFMGHSFFIPIADQFDKFASKSNNFPGHDVQLFKKGGYKGSPLYLWDNHKTEIELILSSGDIELFGMVVGVANGESDDPDNDDVMSPEDIVNGYKQWIDLALIYNPNTSIFIGLPWPDYPTYYDDANTYIAIMKENGSLIYENLIAILRSTYPNTNIYYLNYGIVTGAMMKLFEQDKLIGITEMTKNKNNNRGCIFTDIKGHACSMLKELAALSWLSWFYGVPADYMINIVGQVLGWNEENVANIFRAVAQINKGYRLYETVP